MELYFAAVFLIFYLAEAVRLAHFKFGAPPRLTDAPRTDQVRQQELQISYSDGGVLGSAKFYGPPGQTSCGRISHDRNNIFEIYLEDQQALVLKADLTLELGRNMWSFLPGRTKKSSRTVDEPSALSTGIVVSENQEYLQSIQEGSNGWYDMIGKAITQHPPSGCVLWLTIDPKQKTAAPKPPLPRRPPMARKPTAAEVKPANRPEIASKSSAAKLSLPPKPELPPKPKAKKAMPEITEHHPLEPKTAKSKKGSIDHPLA